MVKTIAELNADLFKLWSELCDPDTTPYVPLPFREPSKQGVVFVGLNPSFSDRGWDCLTAKSRAVGETFPDPHTFYRWTKGMSVADFDVETAIGMEDRARRWYAYFDPCRELAAILGLDWEHLDLFAYQETKQARAASRLFVAPIRNRQPSPFGERQLELFREVLVRARPKLVVVINALASDVYKRSWSPKFNAEDGYYVDRIGEASVPVFFSGMLTGQRALDVSSRERLYWHVARAHGTAWAPRK